ncbi:hypothetical protein PMIN06_009666 [Paraphaeosphaeria minitans]
MPLPSASSLSKASAIAAGEGVPAIRLLPELPELPLLLLLLCPPDGHQVRAAHSPAQSDGDCADVRQNVGHRAVGGGLSWQHQPIDDEETCLVTQDRTRQLRGLTPSPMVTKCPAGK